MAESIDSCPSDKELRAFADRKLTEAEDLRIRDHLFKCPRDQCAVRAVGLGAWGRIEKELRESQNESTKHIPRLARGRIQPPSSGGVAAYGAVVAIAVGMLAQCLGAGAVYYWSLGLQLGRVDRWLAIQTTELRLAIVIAAIVGGMSLIAWLFKKSMSRVAIAFIVGIAVTAGVVWVYAGEERQQASDSLNSLFSGEKWVAYEPSEFDPVKNPTPSIGSMTRELAELHEAFDGLITFNFDENLLDAAQKAGFKKVIVGIHVGPDANGKVLKPEAGINKLSDYVSRHGKAFVCAVCVGHNTSVQVPLADLWAWQEEVRTRTGLPVTSTFPLVSYLAPGAVGAEIRSGDFLFPDVAPHWQFGCTADKALDETRRSLELISQIDSSGKPILLKMLSYPSGGGQGLNEEEQAKFFTGLIRDLYLPPKCHFSAFAGVDIPWKRPDANRLGNYFSPAEEYVGLIKADGTKKKAFEVVSPHSSGGATPPLGWPVDNRP